MRAQRRNLKRQWKEATGEEKEGLVVLMDEIRKKIKAISRAEYERKKKRDKRKKREQFICNPHRCLNKTSYRTCNAVLP